MKLLMIDNYDSFTFNIVQYFGELGAEVTTLRNDGWYEGRMRKSRADRVKDRFKAALRWLFTF